MLPFFSDDEMRAVLHAEYSSDPAVLAEADF